MYPVSDKLRLLSAGCKTEVIYIRYFDNAREFVLMLFSF